MREDAAYNIACVHAFRGEADQAFEWLRKGGGEPRRWSVRHHCRVGVRKIRRGSALAAVPAEHRQGRPSNWPRSSSKVPPKAERKQSLILHCVMDNRPTFPRCRAWSNAVLAAHCVRDARRVKLQPQRLLNLPGSVDAYEIRDCKAALRGDGSIRSSRDVRAVLQHRCRFTRRHRRRFPHSDGSSPGTER